MGKMSSRLRLWLGTRGRIMHWLVAGMVAVLAVSFCYESAFTQSDTKIFLNFKDADIKDVLRAISQQTGINIVAGAGLEGKVTVQLSGVEFDKAIGLVLDAVGAEPTWLEGTVVVTPLKFETRAIALDYVGASEIIKPLGKLLSEKGKIEVLENKAGGKSGYESKIVVSDYPERVREIERIAKELDSRPKLITIEAKLIETSLGKDERLGINWNVAASASGASIPTTAPFDKTSTRGLGQPTPNTQNLGTTLGAAFPPNEMFPYASTGGFSFGKLSAAEFSATLEMISTRTKTNLVSNPKVTTLEDREAEIMVGTLVPIAKYERNKETGTLEIIGYDELKIGVNLTVTPHVTSDGSVTLAVKPVISEIIGWRGQFNERPVMSTREAQTQVTIKDGETLAIGGLVREVDSESFHGIPYISKIPLLGRWLFSHKKVTKDKVDLLVFITPHLIP
ncbi:MAG: hypothetical protein QME66_05380 [Candidatus Eisenbacteria bacterium]|nr:hypothetical protein [Candidatus Eisenbacteria bacterium]